MTAVDVAAWLPQARWFAGKGAAPPDRLAIADAAALPGTQVSLTVLDVAAGDASARYLVPLAAGADAALDPGFAAWLVDAVLGGIALPGRAGVFRGHPAGPRPSVAAAPVRVSALGGDASNTSLLVEQGGRAHAVKLLRRCRPGIQPEVEVGEFFARHAPWAGTPRFLGWLEYAPAEGESIAVATVHEFAAGCSAAWDHLVALVGGGGLSGPGRDGILAVVDMLGRTTAEMHRTLASRPDIPAFAPAEPTAADRQAEAGRMLGHAGQVLALAEARLPSLPQAPAAGVRRLLAARDRIASGLGRLAEIDSRAALIRIHGDYHLGQVLLRASGREALVIDFEGEPGRSLAERRRTMSVLKDVAGMCRSFDYLLRHTARLGAGAYDAADLRLLEARFLTAYRDVAAGHAWWPADPSTADALLGVYTLDKAVYELAYELANRPDWVEVPLAALLT